MPRSDDRAAEMERVLSVLARRDVRRRFYEQLLQELGIELSPLEAWTLARVEEGVPGPPERLAARIGVEPDRVAGALGELQRQELIARDDGWYSATPAGRDLIDKVVLARRERLAARLSGWSPEEHEELAHVLRRLARDLMSEPPRERKTEPPRERSAGAGLS